MKYDAGESEVKMPVKEVVLPAKAEMRPVKSLAYARVTESSVDSAETAASRSVAKPAETARLARRDGHRGQHESGNDKNGNVTHVLPKGRTQNIIQTNPPAQEGATGAQIRCAG